MRLKIATLAAAVAVAVSSVLGANVAAAQAPAKVDVASGMRWATDLNIPDSHSGWCTIAAVGTDESGNLVALTAGHCGSSVPDGSPIWLKDKPDAGVVGHISSTRRNARPGPDYAFLVLDPDKVNIKSQGPLGRIDHIGSNPRPFQDVVCKYGGTTGKTCGLTMTNNGSTIWNFAYVSAGDSGAGLTVAPSYTGLVGIVRSVSISGSEYTNIGAVFAHLNTLPAGAPGRGFVVVNN
ncbi:hypothetical protein [Rhodococcus maanshanensis]|uniref:Trypsin n=1 Tax=Rhodococcus maanshanensis TaxID=183556 RepID=A0A1H7SXK2_9NOCA|nr:hypothetical protein [Rhodococcus maanshanensis]SEL77303.1 hypothetical protein SAMN05444583_114105 [Rhodococcus maanshanensis]